MTPDKQKQIDDFREKAEALAKEHSDEIEVNIYDDGDCLTITIDHDTHGELAAVEVCAQDERNYLGDRLDGLARKMKIDDFLDYLNSEPSE